MTVTFTKVDLPHGWLGNMAPCPVKHAGKWWKTTEALFQALRFEDETLKEKIRAKKSPMGAKWTARKYVKLGKNVVVPQGKADLKNMEMALRLKLEHHKELRQKLLDTGDETIIEDCTKRHSKSAKFWGASLKDGQWVGENTLGKMWMKLRDELPKPRAEPRIADPVELIRGIKDLGARAGGIRILKELVDVLAE